MEEAQGVGNYSIVTARDLFIFSKKGGVFYFLIPPDLIRTNKEE